jgi:co-chaperonin GroES (HSP10)
MFSDNPLNNQVIVKIKPEEYERLKGFELDNTFKDSHLSVTAGEIVSVPKSIRYNKGRPSEISWETTLEVEIGDTVIFHYLCFYNATISDGDISGKIFEKDGETFLYVSYSQLFLAVRDEEIIMLNGYVLAEKTKIEHKLDVPEEFQDLKNIFTITHNGSNNKQYVHKQYNDADVEVGNLVLTKKNCDVPLQYPHFNLLEKEYVRIQKNNIIAKIKS